ncbi:MAG: helix-turn-helix domain-containing protein [Saprospiraceae bacterium]
MEEQKPYLDPGLSLQQLAQYLNIREKELSELLNTGLQTSFYAYINAYRLETVKAMLLDPQKQHLTNFAIAQEAGFSSRSTFFNLFKKHVGMTPGAYKNAHNTRQSDKASS